MRDVKAEDTIYVAFTTRAFATGVPTTLAGTPVVSAYEDAGLTQITAGITLSVDHDGVTGLNMLTIVATAANGYDTAKDYNLVITTGTVGGVSVVGETVGQFSIDRSPAAQDLANGTDGLGAIKAETALIVADTNELQVDWVNGGRLDLLLDAIKVVTDALPDSGALTAIGTDTARLTAVRAAVLTDWINGGRLDLLLDAIPTTAMRGTDNAALASVATEARLAELDAANLPSDVDAILTDTGTTLDTKINDIQGGTFSSATDSLEAIRDRGDAAWTTGAGGSDRLLLVDTTIATLASQTSFTLAAGSADDDAYLNCTIVIEDAATAVQKAIGVVSAYTGATKTVTLKYDPAIFTMAATDKVYILAENALKATAANRQLNVAADGDIAGNVDGSVASLVGHTVQTGDSFARLGAPAAASIAADLVVIDNFVDDLESRLTAARATNLDELGSANIPADVDTLLARLTAARAALLDEITAARLSELDAANIPTDLTNIQGDTDDIQTRIPATLVGGRMDSDIGAKTGNVALSAQEKLDVNTEVDTALGTTTYAEPGQGAPGATISLAAKIGYIYKNFRNRKRQSSTTWELYNDDATTVDQKATVSDDGTNAEKTEIATGP